MTPEGGAAVSRRLQLQLATIYAASLCMPAADVVYRGSGLSPMKRIDRAKKRKQAKAQRQARKRNR